MSRKNARSANSREAFMRPLIGAFHAQMVVESWAGKTPNEIAAELHCHPQTARIHLARFNAEGINGLGMREGVGRKPRLSEQERSQIRRIYLREGVRWRRTHSWGTSDDEDFVPKERRSSPTTPSRPKGRRPSVSTNSDR